MADEKLIVDYKCKRCGNIFHPFTETNLELGRASVENALQQFGAPMNFDRYKVPMFLIHQCSRAIFGVGELLGYSIED